MISFSAKWGGAVAGTSGGLVTWSFAQFEGGLLNFSRQITEVDFVHAVRRAFDAWEAVADINFQEVTDFGPFSASIRIGWSFIDGPRRTVGRAQWSSTNDVLTAAEIEFEEQETWSYSENPSSFGTSAYAVALHEIGHAMGLDHTLDPTSIMYPIVSALDLSSNDILEISRIYGGVYPSGFDSLLYIASHDDLIRAFGANAAAGEQHWVQSGRFEGRQITFDVLNYIASYSDLIEAFGVNLGSGTVHFITAGRVEGRGMTFDGLSYIASHADLTQAFGEDATAGARHWITNGYAEGRQTTFDGLTYIASHDDLIRAFGADASRGAAHWIAHGRFEGRTTSFDAEQYLASHDDLVLAFGPDRRAALTHWLAFGYAEGRTVDDFDEIQYLANYADLQAAYSNDAKAATDHYINYGLREGRTDSSALPQGLQYSEMATEGLVASHADAFVM